MRVSIEDGVYNLLQEKLESMFDNGKGIMIQRTDIFLVPVGMRWNLVGARWRASKSESRGGESEGGRVSYGMKKIYERVCFFEWIKWQYLRHLESYSMGCHLMTNKLYGAHDFELIRCYRSESWWEGDIIIYYRVLRAICCQPVDGSLICFM